MPVFNYKCNSCGNDFDLITGVGQDKEELKCPECKSEDIQKNYSSFGFNINTKDRPGCSGGCCSCR